MEEILALAKTLTGAPEGEEEALRLLCAAAEREVLDRGGPECPREVCLCAAAWLAAAGWLTGRAASDGGGSWKVGEVSWSSGGRAALEAAEGLRQQAWRLLAGAGRDPGFAFREVRG